MRDNVLHEIVRLIPINIFPRRGISRRGTMECPGRSPDLSLSDFLLRGHLKIQVSKKKRNLQQLEARIRHEIKKKTLPNSLQNCAISLIE